MVMILFSTTIKIFAWVWTVMAISSTVAVAAASTTGQPHAQSNRKLIRAPNHQDRIDEQYIVVFKNTVVDVDSKIKALTQDVPGSHILYQYNATLKGAAVEGITENMLSTLLEDSDVDFVEEDFIIYDSSVIVQSNPTWGLDRIDSRNRDNAYTYHYTGRGVKVFIPDSGIRSTHQDFGGRVVCAYSVFDGNGCTDSRGHGTHVAGTVGGSKYGVAKEVELVSIQILDANGEGSGSSLISALDYVRQQKNTNPAIPMIANLSLRSQGSSPAMRAAAEATIAAGVVVVVSAGNLNDNACTSSGLPSVAGTITVGAIDDRDFRSSFSNYGTCVDIFAPGSDVESAGSSSDTAVRTISGTSMAAPHVSGVAALYLEAFPYWTPGQVWDAIRADAVGDSLRRIGTGSPNLLVSTENLTRRFMPFDENGNAMNVSPQCKRRLGSCRSNTDCCSGGCTLRTCWFW